MKRKIYILAFLVSLTNLAFGQLSAPSVEAVYGGRINAITGFAKTADTSRIFVATESANSIFYGDVSTAGTIEYGCFQVMPGVDANAGYGANIQSIAAHGESGKVFFIHQSGLLSSHPASSVVDVIHSGNVHSLAIYDSTLYFANEIYFYFGNLDASGAFTQAIGSPISWTSVGSPKHIIRNPVDSLVYVYAGDSTPLLHVSDSTFNNFDGSTLFNDISPTTLSTSVNWRAFGIGPDGRLFLGGDDSINKYIAYSDDGLTWTEYMTSQSGVAGNNFDFSGTATNYTVYFSKGYNNANGVSGSWFTFGDFGGFETHPNDGSVFTDPTNQNVCYMTTDEGLGTSADMGFTINEFNCGIEAVQVNGFDMTSSKYTGWLASKSGIRKVSDYVVSPLWSNSMFPNGDGSPYYSVDISHDDSTNVYVGNVRIYKTYDDGNTWSQIFTPENAPYNFPGVGTKALAIKECDFDTNLVMAGFEIQGDDEGGLFVSYDAGSTWDQILLEASSVGMDVDITDILITEEAGDTVAYASAIYDLASPQGMSVYKLVKSGTTWTVTQDFGGSTTSVGYSIVVTIWDLELSVTGDTVIAVGTDAGINHPTAYYKPLNTTALWTPYDWTGLGSGASNEATAVTVGGDTVFCAAGNELFYKTSSSTGWTLGYSYPVGTRINVLYYDELIVGCDLGLFGHMGLGLTSVRTNKSEGLPEKFILSQNYPNPFNPSTTINFSIPNQSEVSLIIYDVLGREVAEILNEQLNSGNYSVNFDASNISSGLYFYTLKTNSNQITRKMLLLK